jgi:hypothetical protein
METRLDDLTVSISSIYDEPVFSSEGKRKKQGRATKEETSEEETVRKGSQALDDPGLILALALWVMYGVIPRIETRKTRNPG